MKFDKAINFFTFMVISLPTTLQKGPPQRIECISDQYTIYPDFLLEAGTIMNAYIKERNVPVNYISTLESYWTYARKNLNIMNIMENKHNLCTYVSRLCDKNLYDTFNDELIKASFFENKPSPFLINPNVNFTFNPPEDFLVTPTFSELLPKTTTVKCVQKCPAYCVPDQILDFYVTKLSDSLYPLFVFKRQPSSTHPSTSNHRRTQIDNRRYELAHEVLLQDVVQTEVQISKTSQLPADEHIKEEVS